MRAIHLVLSFVALLLSLISTAQIQLGLIDRIIHNDPTVSTYKQKNLCAFMAVGALDHKTRSVYLISAFGGIEDSMQLPGNVYEQLRQNQTTPFELFDRAYTNAINNIRQTREVIRSRVQNSSNKLPAAINVVFPLLENTVSDFEKIVFLDEFYAHAIIKKHLLKISNPKHTITNDSVYSNTEKVQAGSMQIYKDSVIWYSSSYASTLLKAKLFVARSVIVYYDRNGIAVDSLLLNPKKLPVLTAKKTNVFLLYRNLQETRVQQLLKRIRALENEQKKNNNYYQNAARKINGEGDSATYLENSLHQLLEQIALVVTPDIKAVNSYIRDFADEHETANHLLRVLNVPFVTHYNRGIKYYELTDHRGNIMAIVSDKKKGVDSNNDDKVDYYKAEVSSATDYASFGAYLPERTLQSSQHRYGFNGKENDNEVKGEGNQQDYGMRIYDGRLGRFLSVDPLSNKFPWNSTYAFAENDVIRSIDLEGREKSIVIYDFSTNNISRTVIDLPRAGPLGAGVLVKSNLGQKTAFYYGNEIPNPTITSFKKAYEGVVINRDGNHLGYLDSKGYPTIGYGHLIKEGEKYKVSSTITETEAQELFNNDAKAIFTKADQFLKGFALSENQRNALYDASFNMGPGKMAQYDEKESKYSKENFFLKFMAGGEGLRKRRFAENLLYSLGKYIHLDVLKPKSSRYRLAEKVVVEALAPKEDTSKKTEKNNQ